MIHPLGNQENEHLEYKESSASWKEAAVDIVAFANKSGGDLYVGVKDDGTLLGLTKSEKTIRDLVNNISSCIDPRIHCSVYWEKIGKYDIMHIHIERSSTPYHTAFDIAYIRSGSVSQKMSKTEYQTRLLTYAYPTYDFSQQLIDGATIEDIDKSALRVLRKKLVNPRVNFVLPDDDVELLKNLHLIQNDKLTYASIILLGTTLATRRYLPFAEVSYGYRLSEGDAYNLDDFVGQGGYLLYADDLWNKINARNLRLNISVGLGLDTSRFAFEEETVREAINNAVIHRDYRESVSIFIVQYPYLLQVISPGGFPEGITLSNISDESKPRNKLLADSLRLCNMVDEFGNGVNKMIANQLRRGKNMPDYTESKLYKVVLKVDGSIADEGFAKYMINLGEDKQKMLNDKQLTMLRQIKNGEKVKINSTIQQLLDHGLIEKAGYGKYILCKQYYIDHGKKGVYTESKGLSDNEISFLICRYLGDYPDGSSRTDINNTPSLQKVHWMKIYRMLKKLESNGYVKRVGKKSSPSGKRILLRPLTIT